jgi:rSAM/selenodomain-associated transferase 1
MRRLALFARRPETGRIKTRLAPALTLPLTLGLYRSMLADAFEAGLGSGVDERSVWWADAQDAHDASIAAALVRGEWQERTQPDGDLGTRLTHAFAELLRDSDDRAVVFGADCPTLDQDQIEQAFRELTRSDVVLGPASDGGYTLIGLGRARPQLFANIAWSSDQVLQQTLDRAEAAGLTVTLLTRLDDIDTPRDLVRSLARELARGPHLTGTSGPPGPWSAPRLGSHTRAALRDLGLLP